MIGEGVRTDAGVIETSGSGGAVAAPPVSDHPVAMCVQPRVHLSDREVEVMRTWFALESKGEAAAGLFISASIVATHISRVRGKYRDCGRSAPSQMTLFVRMLEDGYISLDEW